MIKRLIGKKMAGTALLALVGCASAPGRLPDTEVRPGIDVLVAGDMASLRGMRVGLITNHSGMSRSGESTIDVLHRDNRIKLVALFAPEHGIRGNVEGGITIDAGRDDKTGLPIHSLYGATRAPTAAMLADIDALVVDLQGIGSRYWTYPWTMTHAMQAAATHGKRIVVLDRPNPIGGTLVQGNVSDTTSFVGQYHMPMRHGMTIGEIARWVNSTTGINADLVVIPVAGLTRAMWFDDTGLPWKAPSPNMPSLESATHYAGLCIFEGTNLSVGRGTPFAFQVIGAPWLDAHALKRALELMNFPGVRFETTTFTPVKPGDGKYDGQLLHGLRLITTDRTVYDPTRVAVAALLEARRQHHDEFKWTATFPRLFGKRGARDLIEANASYASLTANWDTELAAFRRQVSPYLIYR